MLYNKETNNTPLFHDKNVSNEKRTSPLDLSEYSDCFRIDSDELLEESRRLTASVYLARGFVSQDQVNSQGLIADEYDPYVKHSTYYATTSSDKQQISATLRLINYNPEAGKRSFPMISEFEDCIEPEFKDKLEKIGYSNIHEISALARDRDLDSAGVSAMQLYRTMFLDAWSDKGIDADKSTFIMACNPKLADRLKLLFGESMQVMGSNMPYTGQEAVPLMFENFSGAIDTIKRSRDAKNPYKTLQSEVVKYFFNGADIQAVHPGIVDTLKDENYTDLLEKMTSGVWENVHDYDVRMMSRMKRAGAIGKARELFTKDSLKKYWPEAVATAGLLGYTAARTAAVGVGMDATTDAEWEVFLAIELGTTPTYVLPMGDLIRNAGKSPDEYARSRKYMMLGLAGGSYVAPYAYLYGVGGLESAQGAGTFAGLVGVAVVPALAKAVKKRLKKKRELNS